MEHVDKKNSHESNLQIDSMCSIVIRAHLKFIKTQSKAPSARLSLRMPVPGLPRRCRAGFDNYEKAARRGRPNGISNWF